MLIFSIVRTVAPGATCSYPAGRTEVYHLGDCRGFDCAGILHVTTHEQARRNAEQLVQNFQNCCYTDGIRYSVEEIDEESPDRAPLKVYV